MPNFEEYKRIENAELRPLDRAEEEGTIHMNISISPEDLSNGSPKIGDMIARNPKNHKDQWLVAAKYFNDNFEEI